MDTVLVIVLSLIAIPWFMVMCAQAYVWGQTACPFGHTWKYYRLNDEETKELYRVARIVGGPSRLAAVVWMDGNDHIKKCQNCPAVWKPTYLRRFYGEEVE